MVVKENPEDIVIIRKGKMINGQTAVLYTYKDQPDLRRIKIQEDDNIRWCACGDEILIEGDLCEVCLFMKEEEDKE